MTRIIMPSMTMKPNFLSAITPTISAKDAKAIAAELDLRSPPVVFYSNPYPVYAALREFEPVRRMPDGSVLITRYKDLIQVYKDAHTFSSDKKIEFTPKFSDVPNLLEHHTTCLVFNDPPLHTQVRQIMMGALTRRAIDQMETSLTELVSKLADNIEAQGGGDLIEDFAAAIPIEVIGNLLNIPHVQRGPLRDWSLAILGALEPKISDTQAQRGDKAVVEFLEYLKLLVADRRANPGNPESDVLTRLIQGERSDNGQRLSENELLHNCIFILNAGHETTTNLIGNALVALEEWPSQKEMLIKRIAESVYDKSSLDDVLNTAVDEFLRFESSNQLGNRRATVDCVVGGVSLAKGTLITLCIGSANRDPAQFERAEEMDITRPNCKHLSFAFGIHQCAGLHLARLEGRVALQIFLQRFPNYKLTAAPTRGGRARFRGFLNAPFSIT
jgi:cytochrome P450